VIPASSLARHKRPTSTGLSVSEATDIAGTLSNPSKMPGFGYGLPASECVTGSKLARVAGSVCHGCYALKGNYIFGNVQGSQYNRLAAIDNPAWVDALVTLIETRVSPTDAYFRWHDSGDLQSLEHLRLIVEVCRRTPWVSHWLPTREYAMVRDYLASGETFPPNLVVRMSAHMVDGPTPDGIGLPVSGVFTDWEAYQASHADARRCSAPSQGNECRDCRLCWQSDVRSVSYHKH
jgi:Gene product 88